MDMNPETWQSRLSTCIDQKQPTIIYSDPGYGKTHTVRLLAQTKGLHLIETNSSLSRNKEQLLPLLEVAQTEGFKPTLIFFDEVDGVSDFPLLQRIIQTSVHPIVMACNEIGELSSSLKQMCILIKAEKPRLQDVVNIVKKVAGPRADLTKVTNDIRASLLASQYGGTQRVPIDYFKETAELLKHGTVSKNMSLSSLGIWLVDNLSNFYMGLDLVDNFELLALADYYDRPEFLSLLPRALGTVEYPRFFTLKSVEKVKDFRSGKATKATKGRLK